MGRFTGVLGILAVLLAAWLFSTDRRHIRWRTIAWGLGLQFTFAFIVLRSDLGSRFMTWAGGVVTNMLSATFAGTQVLFGQLGLPNSGAFGNMLGGNKGAIFAFQVLPTIIFISAFFAVLYHIGLMQIIIRGMAWIMLKTMRISGAESMNVAASIFMGQTEAPLTIRPFLSKATRSELMTIMTSGMAHVSGGIMAMYIAQGVEARHLLSAVIMTSPGTILLAKMLVPETDVPATEGKVVIPKDELHADENFIGAIARGTIDGGKLAMNVAIMLISFLALVALLDMILGWVHGLGYMHWVPPGLGLILGFFFRPVAWVIGVPWQDCGAIGTLLGTRMALNEVIAYISSGRAEGDAAAAVVYDCDVCAVRICEPGIDRNADRRHRRAGSGTAQRPGAAGRASDAGRNDGEPDLGVDCGDVSGVSASSKCRTGMNPAFLTIAKWRNNHARWRRWEPRGSSSSGWQEDLQAGGEKHGRPGATGTLGASGRPCAPGRDIGGREGANGRAAEHSIADTEPAAQDEIAAYARRIGPDPADGESRGAGTGGSGIG